LEGDNPVKNRQTRRQPWKKQLTGDNPVKNRQIRRQPWKKQLTGDNPVKNRQTRRKTWAKTRNYPKTNGEQRLVCRKAYELLLKEYCMNSDNLGNSDRAGGCPWELRQVSLPKL
jgi:hypothetical protein